MLRRDKNRSCSTTLSNVAPVARFWTRAPISPSTHLILVWPLWPFNIFWTNSKLFTWQSIGQSKSLQVLVILRLGQAMPPWPDFLSPLLVRTLSPPPQNFEQELHLLQTLTWGLWFFSYQDCDEFTSQLTGQGNWLQVLAWPRSRQLAPPKVGWVTTSLPRLLCPGSDPQLQDFEHELQSLQALTWSLYSESCLLVGLTSQSIDSTQTSLNLESTRKVLSPTTMLPTSLLFASFLILPVAPTSVL